MTEAEKKIILDSIVLCKSVVWLQIGDMIQKQMESLTTHSEPKASEEEIDDWVDAIEARIDRLEQRMAWHENNKLDQLKDVLNR